MALTLPFPYSFPDSPDSPVDHAHLHVPVARVRSRVNSGVPLSPAVRASSSPSNAASLADTAAPTEEDVQMKDVDPSSTFKRRRVGDEDVSELSGGDVERDAKKVCPLLPPPMSGQWC